MKAITVNPMTAAEVFKFTGKDAVCDMDGDKVRIMNASPGQEIEVEKIIEYKGKRFGLKDVSAVMPKKIYQYQAMLVK